MIYTYRTITFRKVRETHLVAIGTSTETFCGCVIRNPAKIMLRKRNKITCLACRCAAGDNSFVVMNCDGA